MKLKASFNVYCAKPWKNKNSGTTSDSRLKLFSRISSLMDVMVASGDNLSGQKFSPEATQTSQVSRGSSFMDCSNSAESSNFIIVKPCYF